MTELPRIKPLVTEDRRQRLWWGAGGASTPAAGPAPMPRGRFGPRGQAPVGYLTGRIGASHREGQDLLAPGCQPEVSVGSVGALEQAVSAALALPVAAAATYVQRQLVRKADETSGREKTKRAGLWISVPPLGTSFRVLQTRGAAGAKDRGRWGGARSGRIATPAIMGLSPASANSAGRIGSGNVWRGATARAKRPGLASRY